MADTFLTPPADDRGTMLDLFRRNEAQIPTHVALWDGEVSLTWARWMRLSRALALALAELGLSRGAALGLQMVNRHEHLVADLAAMMLGAAPTSFYNTLAPEQLAYVAGNSAVRIAVVDPDMVAGWQEVRDEVGLTHLVVLDADAEDLPEGAMAWEDLLATGLRLLDEQGPDAVEAAMDAVEPDDTLTVVYTSGTTGPPKGVVVTHRGMRTAVQASEDWIAEGLAEDRAYADWRRGGRLRQPAGLVGVSYLPLAHVGERWATYYVGAGAGAQVHLIRDMLTLADQLPRIRPHSLGAVPRVWEKLHAAIVNRLAEAGGAKEALGRAALETALEWGRVEAEGRRPDLPLRLRHGLFERLLYGRMREAMGLDRLVLSGSGAAPISPDLLCTFRGIGLPIVEGWGMTETSGLMTVTRINESRPGSVGRAHETMEMRIAEDGELLVRGPQVTPGYLNRPDATAEAIDADGWLHTGDLGSIDDAGNLRIIGRKKEIIINSAGKNLSPNAIEDAIKSADPMIAQVAVIGDGRKFITALVVLDPDLLQSWCEANGVAFETFAQASQEPVVRKAVEAAIEAGNGRLARVEQVKRFTILDEEWTAESPELTPTMKLRRPVIAERHAQAIEEMYAGV